MTLPALRRRAVPLRQSAAMLTAFALPLSTSAQAIAVGLLVVATLCTLDPRTALDRVRHPAAWLPIALFGLVLLGVLWSPAPSAVNFKSAGNYAKLLLIPLLIASTMTPRQALQIGAAFLAACLIVLALSWMSLLWPGGPWGWFKAPGVPFKDNAVQSGCFALCAFGLGLLTMRRLAAGDRRAATIAGMLALLFVVGIFMIYLSKTAMLATVALLALLAIHAAHLRRAAIAAALVVVVAAAALYASPAARLRLAEISVDITAQQGGGDTPETLSTASRIDFWRKAGEFVRAAPIVGHGTGSIQSLYRSLEARRPSPYGSATADPHNQFLNVVLQVGLIGGGLLLALWASHAWLFRGYGAVLACGQAVVLQNVLGGVVNSHIATVTQGMLYCCAVGMLGAVVLTQRERSQPGAAVSPGAASA